VLIIRNEENFAEKSTFSFTYSKMALFLLLIGGVFLVIALFLAQTLLARYFDPRYMELANKQQLITLSQQVDSLMIEVDRKDVFIQSFQKMLTGSDSSIYSAQPVTTMDLEGLNRETVIEDPVAVDSQFRRAYEQSGVPVTLATEITTSELQEMFLFPPLSGFVSSPFSVETQHYGIDIVAKSNEPVKAVADGTVIMASWTQDKGYVLALQHSNNLISVYMHNDALLKKVGNFVSAGEIISIIGNTGELTDGPHLHMELWYNGSPVNPEAFISF